MDHLLPYFYGLFPGPGLGQFHSMLHHSVSTFVKLDHPRKLHAGDLCNKLGGQSGGQFIHGTIRSRQIAQLIAERAALLVAAKLLVIGLFKHSGGDDPFGLHIEYTVPRVKRCLSNDIGDRSDDSALDFHIDPLTINVFFLLVMARPFRHLYLIRAVHVMEISGHMACHHGIGFQIFKGVQKLGILYSVI